MPPSTEILKKEYVYMIGGLMNTITTLFVARIREYEMVFVVPFCSFILITNFHTSLLYTVHTVIEVVYG